MRYKQELAEWLLDIEAAVIRPDDPFTYTSGNKGPIYFDMRLIMSYPRVRDQVTLYYLDLIEEIGGVEAFEVVSGTATAGIPLASWVADRLRKPMIYVRSSNKSYGLEKAVEGVLKRSQRVLVVEDIVNFGTSSIGNIERVREQGGLVEHCVSIADFEQKQAHADFAKAKVKLHSMITVREVVEFALQTKYLTKKQYESVVDWLDKPTAWAKRHSIYGKY
jgi:orotate phosphoribosyltransferase